MNKFSNIAFLLFLVFVFACSQKAETQKNTVIAKVNGDPIYVGDFLNIFEQLKAEQDDISTKNPKLMDSLKTRALNEAIVLEIGRAHV